MPEIRAAPEIGASPEISSARLGQMSGLLALAYEIYLRYICINIGEA